jgi:predicted ATPase
MIIDNLKYCLEMFLQSIKIKNFRGIANLSISFETSKGSIRRQTIILGENGVGKSNILKAIGLITAGSDALSELIGNPSDWITFGQQSCEISAVIVTKKKQTRNISLIVTQGDTIKDILLKNHDSLAELDDALAHTQRNYLVLGYGASRRLNKGSNFSSANESLFRLNRSQSVGTLFNSDALLTPLSSWAMDFDYRSEGKGIDIIRDAISSFMPGLTFDSIDKQRGLLLFRTADNQELIPLQLLSDGYQNMAAWIGDLLYRVTSTFEDYRKPLEARGILLIDEVDLHLHPRWQRMLLKYISQKLPNFQLIATTHSVLTAQQADEGELYTIQKKPGQPIEMVAFVGVPKRMLVHQLLMSPMFGLESDESAEVEKLKEDYRKVAKKSPSSEKSQKLAEQIKELPVPARTASPLDKEHLSLLEEIKQELQQLRQP